MTHLANSPYFSAQDLSSLSGPSISKPLTEDTPGQSAVPGQECIASDEITFKKCLNGAKNSTVRKIAVTQDLVCDGVKACHFTLKDLTGPLLIYSKPQTGSTVNISRKNHFNSPIFEILNSSDIEIRGIRIIEEGINKPSGSFGTVGIIGTSDFGTLPAYAQNLACDSVPNRISACSPSIIVSLNSKKIKLDRIAVLEGKGFPAAITVWSVTGLTIRNSLIVHSWSNGIWNTNGKLLNGDYKPIDLQIKNNVFTDNRRRAIEVPTDGASSITGNLFSYNHMGSIYAYPGGQVAVETTDRLVITDNEIQN